MGQEFVFDVGIGPDGKPTLFILPKLSQNETRSMKMANKGKAAKRPKAPVAMVRGKGMKPKAKKGYQG